MPIGMIEVRSSARESKTCMQDDELILDRAYEVLRSAGYMVPRSHVQGLFCRHGVSRNALADAADPNELVLVKC